jgi:hypothetical protein
VCRPPDASLFYFYFLCLQGFLNGWLLLNLN